MTIASELLAIQQANPDNILHASDAVAWARANPGSALHKAIEWNDERAADEFRLVQVRRLIQLHIVAEDGTPKLVSLSFDRENGGGYRSISDVVKVPDLREVMLLDALRELERVQKKYARIEALAAVWTATEAVRIKSRRKGRGEEPRTAA